MFCHPYSNREENTSPRAVETVSRDDKGERKANHHHHHHHHHHYNHHHHHHNHHRKNPDIINLWILFSFCFTGLSKPHQFFYSLFQTIQRQAVRLSDVNMPVTQTPFDCHLLVCFTCRGDIGNRFWRTKRCLLKLESIRLYVTLIIRY